MAIQKAALLRQITRLTASQCTQLGVKGPYRGPRNGVEASKAIEAWLGDGVLYDAEGNEISLGDMESMFESEGDPMGLTLHAGVPAEEEEAEEEAAEAPAEAAASIRSMIRQEMASRSLPAVPRVVASTTKSRTTKWFKTDEDKKHAGHWLNAKFWKNESSQKWLNDYAGGRYGAKDIQKGDDNALGGYTVPDPLEAAILEVRQEFGVARQLCRIFQASSDSDKIPTKTALPTVYYPDQGASITESTSTYGQVDATIKKRAVLVKYSSELLADSVLAIADDLAENCGRVLGIRSDAEFINGNGSSSYGDVTGIKVFAHTSVAGAGNSWGALTLANFASVVGGLEDKYHAGASWVMSRAFFGSVVLRVLAAAGGNTFESIAAGATGGGMLLGYPIHFTDQAPISSAADEVVCWFGDWRSGVVFADRGGVQMATSEHLGFADDEIAIRVTSRYDIVVHDGSSFVDLKTPA